MIAATAVPGRFQMSDTINASVSTETRSVSASRTADGRTGRYSDAVIAYGLLRLSFGVNIMLPGVSRLLVCRAGFLAYLNHYFEHTRMMPKSFLPAFGTVLPIA